jgi:hypothetical protein
MRPFDRSDDGGAGFDERMDSNGNFFFLFLTPI